MIGHGFKVDDLQSFYLQCIEQAGFSNAGQSADDTKLQHGIRQLSPKFIHYESPVGLVAAFKGSCSPPNRAQDGSKGSRSLPASPAVDQGIPASLRFAQRACEVLGNRLADIASSEFTSLERALTIQSSNLHPLFVGENGEISRARQMILFELEGGADIDNIIKFMKIDRQ